jgi:hypothetical protein
VQSTYSPDLYGVNILSISSDITGMWLNSSDIRRNFSLIDL